MRAFFLALALTAVACTPASPPNASLEIRDGWAPPTPNGVDVSAGYVTIVNGTSADEQLTGVSSSRAERVEMHEMIMDGAVMRMRTAASLTIPAHGQLELAPSGRHLMFFGVSQRFATGEEIPVTLTFAHAGSVNTVLTVQRGGGHGH
jgi:copper(I)-binding protein